MGEHGLLVFDQVYDSNDWEREGLRAYISFAGFGESRILASASGLRTVRKLPTGFALGGRYPITGRMPDSAANKKRIWYPSRVKLCRVAFRDSDGVEHAVEVEARTLYEAVGLAIDRFRRCEHVGYEPMGLHEFIVESREPSTEHRLTRNTFDSWLRRPGGSPADVALKTRLNGLLGEGASSR